MVNQKCAHPDCNCQISAGDGINRDGQVYCSTKCADVGMSREGKCNCGHSNCK